MYDLMEPLRPQVDRVVLNFLRSHSFRPHDFVLRPDGACRLHPQLSRQIAELTVSDAAIPETVSPLMRQLAY